MNCLFVGGKFDLAGGDMSERAAKAAKVLTTRGASVCLFNGGDHAELSDIFSKIKDYDAAFVWAKTDKALEKPHIDAPSTLLVGMVSKPKDEFDYMALRRTMVKKRQHLCVVRLKDGIDVTYRLYDVMGNLWYDGFSLETCITKTYTRLVEIKEMHVAEAVPNVDIVNVPTVPADEDFFNFLSSITDDSLKNVFPSFRKGGTIAFTCRRGATEISATSFAPALMNEDKVEYFGKARPAIYTAAHLLVYKAFPNIKYLVHTHSYIKDAPITKKAFLCGAADEADEIIAAFEDKTQSFYTLNLLGHGSIIMSETVEGLYNVEFEERPIPEKI